MLVTLPMTTTPTPRPSTMPVGEVAWHLPAPVVYTSPHLTILWVNRAFTEAFGYRAEEVVGRSLSDLFPHEGGDQLRAHLQAQAQGLAAEHTFWARLRSRQGQMTLVSIQSSQVNHGAGGAGWVHLIQPAQNEEDSLHIYTSDLFVQGWVQALHARDLETSAHTHRVAQLTVAVGRELGLDDRMLRVWRWGALLHDIGKVAVPDNILRKPGPLTPEEWEVMRQHPLLARKILEAAPFLPPEVIEIPLYHHERWDGSGYPFGLRGKQIPLAARVFAVVDVWDALRSVRPYRLPWPECRIVRYLRLNAGVLFDPMIVEIFVTLHRQGLPA